MVGAMTDRRLHSKHLIQCWQLPRDRLMHIIK